MNIWSSGKLLALYSLSSLGLLKLVMKVSKYNGFMSLVFFIFSNEKQTKKSLATASAVSIIGKNTKCL